MTDTDPMPHKPGPLHYEGPNNATAPVMGADPPWLDQWALTVHKNRLATSSLEAIKHIAREAIAFANAQPPSDDAVTEALRVFDSPGQFTKRSRWDAMRAAITAAKARSVA